MVAVDMPGFGDSPDLPEDVPATAAEHRRRGARHAGRRWASSGRTWPASRWAAGPRWSSARPTRALSVTTLCAAGFWRARAGAAARDRPQHGARRCCRCCGRWCRPPAGGKLVLSGPVAHPERVPAEDAYALVRAYATRHRLHARQPRDAQRPVPRLRGHPRARSRWPGPTATARSTRPTSVPAGVEVRRLRDCGHVPTWDSPGAGGRRDPRGRRPGARRRRVRSAAWPTRSRRLTIRRSPMPAGTSSRWWRAAAAKAPPSCSRRPPG